MIQTVTERNQQIIDRCKQLFAGIEMDEILFDHPLKVKVTPHSDLFTMFGVTVQKNDVYLLDGDGSWHSLEANQANVFYVASTLMSELKKMSNAKVIN